jgi:ubiquinone biosynthesis monooxygenase Coq7
MQHLETHLSRIPQKDQRTRAILEQMKTDEDNHRSTALRRGGADFPAPVKSLMTGLSRFMTKTTYWI